MCQADDWGPVLEAAIPSNWLVFSAACVGHWSACPHARKLAFNLALPPPPLRTPLGERESGRAGERESQSRSRPTRKYMHARAHTHHQHSHHHVRARVDGALTGRGDCAGGPTRAQLLSGRSFALADCVGRPIPLSTQFHLGPPKSLRPARHPHVRPSAPGRRGGGAAARGTARDILASFIGRDTHAVRGRLRELFARDPDMVILTDSFMIGADNQQVGPFRLLPVRLQVPLHSMARRS